MVHRMLLVALVWLQGPAMAATLDLAVDNIKGQDGQLFIAVYRDQSSWLSPEKAAVTRRVPVQASKVEQSFELPEGKYAVAIFHDRNSNGKLDMQWLPPSPGEPWVMSRNAQGKFGPPSFDDAVFSLPKNQKLELKLQDP